MNEAATKNGQVGRSKTAVLALTGLIQQCNVTDSARFFFSVLLLASICLSVFSFCACLVADSFLLAKSTLSSFLLFLMTPYSLFT